MAAGAESGPRRILITGSRQWGDHGTIERALRTVVPSELDRAVRAEVAAGVRYPGGVVFVHGGAQGPDTIAAALVRAWGYRDEPHPVTREMWQRYGKRAGYIRNFRMVQLRAERCLAFPYGEAKGTRGCMAMCLSAGIPVQEFVPSPVDAEPYTAAELREIQTIIDESEFELSSVQRMRLVRMMTRRGFRPEGEA